MENQLALEELLRKKGIGPQGSKSIAADEIPVLRELLSNEQTSLTTRATMLTALLTLEPTEHEKVFIEELLQNPNIVHNDLHPFLSQKTNSEFFNLVNKIIRHEDLSESESRLAMDYFFNESEPEFLKAAFLEGERLKRETFTENKIFFSSLWSRVRHIDSEIPKLIHICDNYDGFNRTRNYSLFTAAVLASCGFPLLLTGMSDVAPKFGISHHQLLKIAGKDPLINTTEATKELKNLNWTYLDQEVFFPELHALKTMRKEMVKRPFLATFEKLLQPIRGKENYIVTGYTHPHYKNELVKQLKYQAKCYQAIVLKGMEGSSHMSLGKDTTCIHFNGMEIIDSLVNPIEFGLESYEEKQDKTVTPEVCIQEGLAALHGEKNYARENILYLGALILSKFSFKEKNEAIKILTEAIDSGKALNCWNNKL